MLETDLAFWDVLSRLVAAAVGGAALGWEREAREKPAGLRTNMLVSVGAAAFMVLTIDLCREAAVVAVETNHPMSYDPIRTLAGVIGGIGFLGAGSIFQSRGEVEGLTTAAAIWASGSIGLACGCGRYAIAGLTAVLALIILALMGKLELALLPNKND